MSAATTQTTHRLAAFRQLMDSLLPASGTNFLIHANDFCQQPAPIKWLVKHWIQDKALVMVHGPSGGGKTFVVLDWMLHIAAGKPQWLNHKIKPGNVVYLAGEGHHGLKSRFAAWGHKHSVTDPNLWVSESGCDLNTTEGYLKVVNELHRLDIHPSVIVIDTLHRFMAGDENSAQDAKTMLDACAALMRQYDCTVILVHHTGVSEEAQHRARGSSAWRGALDIEISVIPAKGDKSIEIVQRKSKDAEMAAPVYVDLESVAIPGWFDEDGDPVSSAVVVPGKAHVNASKPKPGSKHLATLKTAWDAANRPLQHGAPYIERTLLKEHLLAQDRQPRTVENDLNGSYSNKLIGSLLQSSVIETVDGGWIVIDAATVLLWKA